VKRALLTFATGEHERLLALSLPGFEAYAERHGYDLVTDAPRMLLRPASWYKVPALLRALDVYEEALWLDADVVIVDGSRDLADEVPEGAWQALVRHHTPDGEVPNGGVWLVRPAMRETLEAIWARDRYLNHGWWEQAALLDLLGYRHPPARLVEPTTLYRRTHWLGLHWNSHEERDRHPRPTFAHATAGSLDWRAAVMAAYIAREPAQEGARSG
jgi:glycosyl transferase family (putative galactosyltransferase)